MALFLFFFFFVVVRWQHETSENLVLILDLALAGNEIPFPWEYLTLTKPSLWLLCLMVLEKAKSWDKTQLDFFPDTL